MEYVMMLDPSFLKCYDFKQEGIWEVCLSGTQLDNSVQNISHLTYYSLEKKIIQI